MGGHQILDSHAHLFGDKGRPAATTCACVPPEAACGGGPTQASTHQLMGAVPGQVPGRGGTLAAALLQGPVWRGRGTRAGGAHPCCGRVAPGLAVHTREGEESLAPLTWGAPTQPYLEGLWERESPFCFLPPGFW